jgi:hypothetical protein
MPDRRGDNQSPGEQAKQRIRELGEAAKRVARKIDQSSPNTQDVDETIRQFQQRITELTRRCPQRGLPAPQYTGASATFFTSPFFLKLLVWVIALGLFAIVTMTIGFWGLFALTLCWQLVLFVLWPPPAYLVGLFTVWLGLFTWRLVVFLN